MNIVHTNFRRNEHDICGAFVEMGGSRLRRATVINKFCRKSQGQLALKRIAKNRSSFNL